ncbi:hypothetical protein Ddc_09689 [Ditylenchus destructor]|nr:hypothetical protein Ddc_09689 [Ditylenchus destructor]
MIDQARYRHHQHRSKFKEAIEYLDHIFEDLKKECDKGSFGSQENQNAAQNVESKPAAPKPNTGGNPSAKSMFDKQQQRAVDVHNKDPNIHTRTLPAKTTANAKWPRTAQTAEKAPGVAPRQAPANAIQRVPQQQQSGVPPQDGHRQNIGQKLAQKHPQNGGDVEVSETIVLPSKNTSDRLDFTRQWLVDDIKSWADNPNKKPDLILGSDDQMGIQYDDNNGSDEHSLGSCSAEVAAINASEKRKKARETPDIIKSSKTQPIKPKQAQQPPPKNTFAHQKSMPEPQVVPNPAPIRPQPFRPQPQFAIYPPSGAESIYELQKVPSHEQLRSRYSQERAASQDYQSLGSVHSQDGFKPASSTYLSTNSLHRGGAFVNYNPTRGSIHSLPDAALLTVNQPPLPQNASRFGRPAPNDHVLAIDALVAELELNTDAPSAIDKRRSFPTTHGEVTSGPGNRRDFGQNAQHQQSALKGNAQSMTKVGPATISIQRQTNPPNKAPVNQPSQSAGLRNSMKQPERSHQQNSLDEVAEMLRDVSDPHHKQTLQPSNQQVHPQTPSPRKFSNPRTGVAVSGEKKVANPFETINQERVNPSRVEAISNMFEGGGKPGVPSSVSTWSKKMARNSSKDTSSEAEDYNAGNSVSEKPKLRGVNIHPIFRQQTTSPQNSDNKVKLRQKPGQVSVQAPFPTTQHPAGLKGKVVPQNGVQFAANSGVGSSSNRNSRGDSLMGKTPNSSVNPQSSADDDDIYDNLPTENRFSQLSEMDDASLCSQNLPPAHKSAGGRFGQLIRKIGGTTGITKPPVHNAASFASLNKVSNDTPMHGRQIGLMKSNSLSNEPWRIHAMKQEEPSESKSMGIGNRLKQTIFGSKKRLQT